MKHIEHSALVTYTAKQMYELVLDVECYPDFLSWVTSASVAAQDAFIQKAGLSISVAGLRTRFETHNHLITDQSITMQLVQGPFSALNGLWQFKGFGNKGCKVALSLDFDVEQRLLTTAFRQGFAAVGNRLVKDFVKRAGQCYG